MAKYLVTKHYGAMLHHVGSVEDTLDAAKKLVGRHSKHVGLFKGKVYLRIWKMIEEKEAVKTK